jgi:hypothetical protein
MQLHGAVFTAKTADGQHEALPQLAGAAEVSACCGSVTGHIRGVSNKFGECYQKTNKTEDTNKLTLLTFKIIAIFHNSVLCRMAIILKANKVNLFVSSVLFVFW